MKKKIAFYNENSDSLEKDIDEIKTRINRLQKYFAIESSVKLIKKDEQAYRIEIAGPDRPSLLYDLTKNLASQDIQIKNAFINTIGWYINDSFDILSSRIPDLGKIKSLLASAIPDGAHSRESAVYS